MTVKKVLDDVLPTVTHQLAAAFAAACAERVYELYISLCDECSSAPKRAIDAVWLFACSGNVQKDEINDINDQLEKIMDELWEEEASDEIKYSVNTISKALNSIFDKSLEKVRETAISAVSAIQPTDDWKGDAEKEESEWQIAALGIIKNWGDRAITRTMFDGLSKGKPDWLLRWES